MTCQLLSITGSNDVYIVLKKLDTQQCSGVGHAEGSVALLTDSREAVGSNMQVCRVLPLLGIPKSKVPSR